MLTIETPIDSYQNIDNYEWLQFQPQESLNPLQRPIHTIVEMLQEGGYILYSRHAEASVGMDVPNMDFQDCSTQRNLSDAGKRQATTYGLALRHLRIPVMYPVLASPFCRTVETANLAFGNQYVEIDPFWLKIYELSKSPNRLEAHRTLLNLQSVLELPPPIGTNQVIIAHNFPARVGLGSIPNMGTVIVRPRGPGNGYELIAGVSMEDWINLLG